MATTINAGMGATDRQGNLSWEREACAELGLVRQIQLGRSLAIPKFSSTAHDDSAARLSGNWLVLDSDGV
jgi:hypothetical protein